MFGCGICMRMKITGVNRANGGRVKPAASVASVFSCKKQSGFALLVTIILVAFLVLVVMALATFTRVETQVSTNSQHLARARQNATMALNIALGQVQVLTGPDQRTTAEASLEFPTAANPRWVGVYGNTNVASYTDTPSAIKQLTPALLNWLVSGNESVSFTANSGTTTTHGRIEKPYPSEWPFTPEAAVTSADNAALADATALTESLKLDGKPARLLVGPATAGDITPASNYVLAPLVDVAVPTGSVPGLSSGDPTSQTTIGRYAWWVGDEGVKARANLRDRYLQTSDSADRYYSFVTAQRSAVELMTWKKSAPAGMASTMGLSTSDTSLDRIGADYDFTLPSLRNILSLNQLPFLGGSSTATQNLATAARQRFHDLTTASYSVQADTFAGGLKKDLTADIADTTSAASGNRPADTDTLFKPQSASDPGIPTWGQLRSWARTTAALENPQAIEPKPATATQAGIGPVISMAGLGFGFEIRDHDSETGGGKFYLRLFPTLVLYNPYTVPIKAHTYQIGFALRRPGNGKVGFSFDLKPVPTTWVFDPEDETYEFSSWGDYKSWGTYTLNDCPDVDNGKDAPGFISFTVQTGDIPPGESHIFTLDSSEGAKSYTSANLMTHGTSGLSRWVTLRVALDETLPNDASFCATSRGMNFDVSSPDGYKDAHMQVVLAEPGGLTQSGVQPGTPTDAWYQGILDCAPYGAGFDSCCKVSNVIILSPIPPCPADPAILLSELEASANTETEPYFGLNVQAQMEASAGNTLGGYTEGSMGTGRTRWLVQSNIRAPVAARSKLDAGTMNYMGSGSPGYAATFRTSYSKTKATRNAILYMTLGNDARASSGPGQDARDVLVNSTLFDILPPAGGLLSLGQLQHAPLSLLGFYPAYPFGNSAADMRLARNAHYATGVLRPPGALGSGSGTFNKPYYDISWHLNRAIWDRYFVSAVPASWTAADVAAGKPLPNARMTVYRREGAAPAIDELRYSGSGTNAAYDRAAAHLLVAGGFNVNSTSEQAWRALLAGTNQLPNGTAYSGSASGKLNAVTPRFARNAGAMNWTADSLERADYSGNRELALREGSETVSEAADRLPCVVDELAKRIVEEVRLRGPFLSLGDFVNRRIVSSTSSAPATGVKGALQRAIDRMQAPYEINVSDNIYDIPMGKNEDFPSWKSWKDYVNKPPDILVSYSDLPVDYLPANPGDSKAHFLGKDAGEPDGAFMSRSAYNPKFLTQADLLSVLGPALSARSDTFLIRAYGEDVNPLDPTDIRARAWCEAVVQRTPDYMDTTDDPQVHPKDATQEINRKFGRRYKVVSFRWLSPADI